jgi:hypothetical protein
MQIGIIKKIPTKPERENVSIDFGNHEIKTLYELLSEKVKI